MFVFHALIFVIEEWALNTSSDYVVCDTNAPPIIFFDFWLFECRVILLFSSYVLILLITAKSKAVLEKISTRNTTFQAVPPTVASWPRQKLLSDQDQSRISAKCDVGICSGGRN